MTSTITDRASGLGSSATPNGENATISVKVPVRVATTANITLSGLQTIDGVTLVANDRVLVKDQTDQTENGIYLASSDAWLRTADCADNGDLVTGTEVRVNAGSTNQGRWYCSSADPIVFGTSNITWGQVTGIIVGDGDKGDVTVSSSGTAWALNADTVDTTEIVDDAVTTAKIEDAAVTFAKFAPAAKASAANIRVGAGSVFVTPDVVESALEEVVITYGASPSWSWSDGVNFTLTLTGDAELQFPTNVEPGTWRTIRIIQDGSGGHTLSLEASAGFYTVSADALALDETASTWTEIHFKGITTSVVAVYPTNGPFQQVT